MTHPTSIAYVSRLIYPDPAANALQTIQMAAALSRQTEHTCLFVHDLSAPVEEIRRQYGVHGAPLEIRSLHTKRWPRFVYEHGYGRFMTYNSIVALILGRHPAWRRRPGRQRIVFVRSRLEVLYWGLMRPYLRWLRDWLFVCEIHDLQGTLPTSTTDVGKVEARQTRRLIQALRNFDLVLTVTAGLAEDLRLLTGDMVNPEVVPLCTGLPRLPAPPAAIYSPDRILLGYVGTIDRAHGLEDVLRSLELLPPQCVLRITGAAKSDIRALLEEAAQSGKVEVCPPVPYADVAAEIDACDIALAPAGDTVHSHKYRSPLKLFDYMARGKPIVAADVACHRELLRDGYNAVMYRQGDHQDLAAQIKALIANPSRTRAIAEAAWNLSREYTYDGRAARLLQHMDAAYNLRRVEQVAYG